jgi:hypothetical protein
MIPFYLIIFLGTILIIVAFGLFYYFRGYRDGRNFALRKFGKMLEERRNQLINPSKTDAYIKGINDLYIWLRENLKEIK